MSVKQNKKLLERKAGKKPIPDSLRQKMAQAVTGAAPSVVPPGIVNPPVPKDRKEAEPKANINDLLSPGEDRDTLRLLVLQQATLNSTVKEIKTQLDPIEKRIKSLLSDYGLAGNMDCEGIGVNYFPNNRSSVDAALLLAHGVSLEVIRQCTKTSNSMTLVITPPKS